ncbi:methyl-accepting chemotaxis protein [Herminiimonas sp.]|uniref:methyl-accepting chemotaxis protein n=1 Tax=Herminiimonas sp. TaxID=1926289 RepID=UPI002728B50A|nr:methyl-accepting chemotaxis protein [Herminiimonas sp.]MDO8306304.1 methyl-accepting chemotaxis protein [Herminiimonas sp.]
MNIKNLKIGTRLGLGFGLVFVLMAILISLALTRFAGIGKINSDMINTDWVKAEAVSTIDTTIRANARRNMELLIETDPVKMAGLFDEIKKNKNTIDDAVVVLDKLISSEAGKSLMVDFKDVRGKYVASFGRVGKMVSANQREEAITTMLSETLPTLDNVQKKVAQLAVLQKQIVEQGGAAAKAHIDAATALMIGLGIAAVILGAGFAWWITHSITRPMKEAVKIAQTVASGDLSSVIQVSSKDETGQLLQALKDMNNSLVRIVGEVRFSTEAIATASTQIASGNLDLSARTEEQASSLEETASSMEELNSTVKQNADNARQANQLALTASEVAMKGGSVVSQVVETMGSINDSSKKIVDIIGVIDGIAFQTNILALNAAVEAARAGEQGRGFAVVASEVRNLAQRSAAAAKEIKNLIGDSVEKVNTGARLVDDAGATMQEVVASVRRVTDIMGEITAAGHEQTAGIEQIHQAVMQMDQVTQQNAALVEEAAAAAESLQDQARNLVQVVSVFKLDHADAVTHVAQAALMPAKKPVFVQLTNKPAAPAGKNMALADGGADWEQF